MRTLRSLALLLTAGLLVVSTAGCDSGGDDDAAPIHEGEFEATTLTFENEDVSGDVLAEGGSFTLDFNEDGTVNGQSVIPASFTEPDEGASEVEADGTYTLEGEDLTFDFDGPDNRQNDNFLGEFVTDTADWTYEDGVIRADVEGATIVLER